MTNQELRDEIQNDPLNLGYAPFVALGQDAAIAAILNKESHVFNQYVSITDIQFYLDSKGIRSSIEDQKIDNAAARTVSRLFDARYEWVRLGNTALEEAIDSLVSSGLILSSDKAAIMSLGVISASRAEVLWGLGSYVDHTDVANALRS